MEYNKTLLKSKYTNKLNLSPTSINRNNKEILNDSTSGVIKRTSTKVENELSQQIHSEMLKYIKALEESDTKKEDVLIDWFDRIITRLDEPFDLPPISELVLMCKLYKSKLELVRVKLGIEKYSSAFILGKIEEFLNIYTEKYEMVDLDSKVEKLFGNEESSKYIHILRIVNTAYNEVTEDDIAKRLGVTKDNADYMIDKLNELNLLEIEHIGGKIYVKPTYLGVKCCSELRNKQNKEPYIRELQLQRAKSLKAE